MPICLFLLRHPFILAVLSRKIADKFEFSEQVNSQGGSTKCLCLCGGGGGHRLTSSLRRQIHIDIKWTLSGLLYLFCLWMPHPHWQNHYYEDYMIQPIFAQCGGGGGVFTLLVKIVPQPARYLHICCSASFVYCCHSIIFVPWSQNDSRDAHCMKLSMRSICHSAIEFYVKCYFQKNQFHF